MNVIENEKGRFYETPFGLFPSVTTVLSHDVDLSDWIARVGQIQAGRITKHATMRGTAVHNLVEAHLKRFDEPRVLNKRNDLISNNAIYVGRGTPWGNPFIIGKDGDRDAVIHRFEQEILPTLDVSILAGKSLVCWCAPKRCHADVLLKAANNNLVKKLAQPIIQWLDQNVTEVIASESALYSQHLKVAGRCDLICRIDGDITIVDFKTSDRPKEREYINDYFLQCAAYVLCAKEMYGWAVNKFKICIVDEQTQSVEIFDGLCTDYIKEFYQRRKLFEERT